MKKFKVMLSVFMVLVIISISVAPVFATDSDSSSQDVIGEDLKLVMDEAEENENIKVYIWYKDIDQNEVDRLTTKATGLSPESCEVITEFPSADVWTSLEKGEKNAQKQMDEYMLRTKKAREKERNRTATYSKKHREIANEKYRQKSQKIRKELSISESENIFSSEFAPMIIAEMTKDEILVASNNASIEEISLFNELEMVEESFDSAIITTNINKVSSDSNLGLTGESVPVAILENSRVHFSTESSDGIVLDQSEYNILTTSNGGTIYDYGNVAVVSTMPYDEKQTHATAVANVLLSAASNVKLYCGTASYSSIETLVSAGVQIFNMSLGNGVLETSSEYAYTNQEKWYDHLISYLGIFLFK